MRQNEKESLVIFAICLWMALGVGMLFGFWWGWVIFPVTYLIIVRYIA